MRRILFWTRRGSIRRVGFSTEGSFIVEFEYERMVITACTESWNTVLDLSRLDWSSIPVLSPFIRADGSQEALQQTILRLCYSKQFFYARFDCLDRDIWGNYTRRDDPIYNEEAVEIFIAPTESDPTDYYEFEISPKGVLFDARIHNPDGKNNPQMLGEAAWDCPGIQWHAGMNVALQHWWAMVGIPWRAISPELELPKAWRANFYRIERPHDAEDEYSCWSPVMTEVADFHRPAQFGILRIACEINDERF